METLVEQVAWQGKLLGEIDTQETFVVMTRRIGWPFISRSRTTVLPGPDCDSTSGFIVWWNTNDPEELRRVHEGMVQTLSRVGFTEPAVWCDRRHQNRNPRSLDYFWRDQLGELFRYYRKAK